MKERETVEFWAALVILAAVAILVYRSIDKTADTLGWIEHAHQALQELENVSGTYSRAAAARRAYVDLGDESQLADRASLDEYLGQGIATLRASLAEDPKQLRRLDSWVELLHERIAGLEASAGRRRAEGVGGETVESLALTTRIRAAREEIEKEENRQLADRDARTRCDFVHTKLAEVIGTGASFAILVLAFWRLHREIRRRRQSEQALRESEGFLHSIVENIPNMIFVKEAKELRFERLNRAGEELLGITRKDLFRKNDFDFFPVEQAENFQALDRETLANGVTVDIPEEPIQTKAGQRWLHTKKVPILDDKGMSKYLLGISEDVTERRLVARALKKAKDAAEDANHELEAFSYSVAHDLRAPLRSIDGFSRALEEDCADHLDVSGVSHLKRIRSSAQQMGQLIDGLLSLSRVTRAEIVREKVDLTRIAQQSGARLQEAHPDREVEWIVHEGLVGEGDARLLSAALDNLLGNAWKFTGKRALARIEVGSVIKNGDSTFFIRDNGAGFEQAYADKLFGAFQRLHTAAEFEGTGIGLATVQRIVRRHGGRIWAESEVGRGATFYFTL
jgi:PAS domain S-box-containing protein